MYGPKKLKKCESLNSRQHPGFGGYRRQSQRRPCTPTAPSPTEQSFSTAAASATTSPAAASVFSRLTSPTGLCGMQRQRFSESGVGLGILGSRDDTTNAELIAGKGVILRGTSSVSPAKIRDPASDYAPPMPCAALTD